MYLGIDFLITSELKGALNGKGKWGRGGIQSKIKAAEIATTTQDFVTRIPFISHPPTREVDTLVRLYNNTIYI
jgi:hypothetical protein